MHIEHDLLPTQPLVHRRRDTKRAGTLTYDQVEQLIDKVTRTSNSPHSDALKLALSFYAGLRVSEIAQLTVADLTTPGGGVAKMFTVRASIAKNGRDRQVPMHPRIRELLLTFRAAHPRETRIAFSSRYGRPRPQSVGAVGKWFERIFEEAGLTGCSSHSGRRTFITHLARTANSFGNSLVDIQRIAGHAQLETTQAYIEPTDSVAALIASLGGITPGSTHQSQLRA
jgi:integrase